MEEEEGVVGGGGGCRRRRRRRRRVEEEEEEGGGGGGCRIITDNFITEFPLKTHQHDLLPSASDQRLSKALTSSVALFYR